MTVLVEDLEFLLFSELPIIFWYSNLFDNKYNNLLRSNNRKKKAAELLKSSTGTTAALGILGYVLASALKLIPEVGTIIGGL